MSLLPFGRFCDCRVAYSRFTFAHTSCGRLAHFSSRTSPPRAACCDVEVARAVTRFGRRLALPAPAQPGFGSLLSRSRWLALSSFRSLPCHCVLANGGHPASAPTSEPRRRASNSGLSRQRNYPAAAQTSPARSPSGNGAATQSRRQLLNCAGYVLVALQCRCFAHKPRQTDRETERQTDVRISTTVFHKLRQRLGQRLTTCASATCCRCEETQIFEAQS